MTSEVKLQWRVVVGTDADGDATRGHYVEDTDGNGIAFAQQSPEHARLIAAAPAMYEALTDARDAVASLDEDALGLVEKEPHHWWPIRDELLSNIDAALRKARGESP
jgi:hypothetical protein